MYRGDNLYLRFIKPDDSDLIFNWENNPDNWKISSVDKAFSTEQISAFVNSSQDIFIHEQVRLIICLNETNEVVGNIDLFDFDNFHKRVGIGVLIDEKHRNKTYAHQAILLTEDYCKVILEIKNVFANILTNNNKSIGLFTKLGYQKIGIKKNWHQYQNNWFDELLFQKELT
jgi:diamine N-acetyltransferase